jgi:hypothetical protein
MATTSKPKKVWDNYKELFEIQKSDRIKFVVAAATRDGFRYINIREFYLRQRDNEWKPGRDGITIPLKAPLNKGTSFIEPGAEMIKAIEEASKYVADMELADDANAVWYQPKEVK